MSSAILSPDTLNGRPVGRLRLAIVSVLGRARALGKALRNRRQVQDLLELDDRALRDIGLERLDVTRALGQPLGRDPSSMLVVRSVERRSRLRRLAPSRRVSAPAVETCP